MLLVAALNRDPRRYENPSRFGHPAGPDISHLTFGYGLLHYCLGANLAPTRRSRRPRRAPEPVPHMGAR
ncbi:MAG: hypothetical protein R2695_19905 [Acidimicrobiales bacterium]